MSSYSSIISSSKFGRSCLEISHRLLKILATLKTQFPIEFSRHVKNGSEFVPLIRVDALPLLGRQHAYCNTDVRTNILVLIHVYLFSTFLSQK